MLGSRSDQISLPPNPICLPSTGTDTDTDTDTDTVRK